MSNRSRSSRIMAALCLAACVAVISAAVLADEEDLVAFNTKSLKYHCLTCQWAQKCTQNCVTVTGSEAIKRGGVPCKVCGGACKKGASVRVDLSQSEANSTRNQLNPANSMGH